MRYNLITLNKILQKFCRDVLRKHNCKFLKFRRSIRNIKIDHVIENEFIEIESEFIETESFQINYLFIYNICVLLFNQYIIQ